MATELDWETFALDVDCTAQLWRLMPVVDVESLDDCRPKKVPRQAEKIGSEGHYNLLYCRLMMIKLFQARRQVIGEQSLLVGGKVWGMRPELEPTSSTRNMPVRRMAGVGNFLRIPACSRSVWERFWWKA